MHVNISSKQIKTIQQTIFILYKYLIKMMAKDDIQNGLTFSFHIHSIYLILYYRSQKEGRPGAQNSLQKSFHVADESNGGAY